MGRVHNPIHDPVEMDYIYCLASSGIAFYIEGLVTAGFMLASFPG